MATESKSAAVIVVLLTFALGMAAGAGLHASFEKPHRRGGGWGPGGPGQNGGPGGPKRLPPPLEELELTADQRTKAEAVFEKYRAPLEALFEETRPRMHELREKMDGEFAEILTDAQKAKFAEFKARRPPHGPPPPGAPPPPPEK
ncbi:MAG: hypothetical protein QM817_37535 [Archangium sp.]